MSTQELSLNDTLVTAVLELIDFYSKKGVFKVNEYKDIATITERLTEVKTGFENDKEYTPFSLTELAFIIQIFKEGSQRVPTAIDSFGQIYAVYQHFNKYLEQEIEKEKKRKEDEEVPTVEELNQK
jgi:hypothetical protein